MKGIINFYFSRFEAAFYSESSEKKRIRQEGERWLGGGEKKGEEGGEEKKEGER